MNTPTDSRPYQPIEGYEILDRLGGGGMGTVFRARQIAMDRVVALKVLRSQLAKDQKYVERLHREARLLGVLDHPNIVRAHDVGASSGYHYFVMEYVEGRSAASLLQERGPLPEEQVLDLAVQMARALEHAHRHDVIHRDIKPGNILLTPAGVAKLTDLGLAKREIDPALTRDEATVGTPQYISPEQLIDPKSVDGRSDIFSLGASLYHLVTGKPPFEGETLGSVVASVLAGQLVDPREHRPDLDPGFARVLVRMLQKNPGDRYRHADELLADLEAIQAGESPVPWSPPRPRPPMARWWGAAAVLGVVVLLSVFLLNRGQSDTAPPETPGEQYLEELEMRLRRAPNLVARLAVVEAAIADPPLEGVSVGEQLLARRRELIDGLRGELDAVAALLLDQAHKRLRQTPTGPSSERLLAETYDPYFQPTGNEARRVLERHLRVTEPLPPQSTSAALWAERLAAARLTFEVTRKDAIIAFQDAFLRDLARLSEDVTTRPKSGQAGSLVQLREDLDSSVRAIARRAHGPAHIRLAEVPDPLASSLQERLEDLQREIEARIAKASVDRFRQLEAQLHGQFEEARSRLPELELGAKAEEAVRPLEDWLAGVRRAALEGLLPPEGERFELAAEDLLDELQGRFEHGQRERADLAFAEEALRGESIPDQLRARRYESARQRVRTLRSEGPLQRARNEPEYWNRQIEAIELFVSAAFEQLWKRVQADPAAPVEVKDREGLGRWYTIGSVETRAPDWRLEGRNQTLDWRAEEMTLLDIHRDMILEWGDAHREQSAEDHELDYGRAAFLHYEGRSEEAENALRPLLRAQLPEPLDGDVDRLLRQIRETLEQASWTKEQLTREAHEKLAEIEQLRSVGDSTSLQEARDRITQLLGRQYQELGIEEISRKTLLSMRDTVSDRLERVREEEAARAPFHAAVRFVDRRAKVIEVIYNFEQPDQLVDWERDPEIWALDSGRLRSQQRGRSRNLYDQALRYPPRENRSLKSFDFLSDSSSEPFSLQFEYRAPEGVDPELLAVSIYGLNIGIQSRLRRVRRWLGDPGNLPGELFLTEPEVSTSDLLAEWGVTYRVKIEVIPTGNTLKVALTLDDHPVWEDVLSKAEFRKKGQRSQIEIRAFHPAILDNITLTGRQARR